MRTTAGGPCFVEVRYRRLNIQGPVSFAGVNAILWLLAACVGGAELAPIFDSLLPI